jgi:sulfur-carrier protein
MLQGRKEETMKVTVKAFAGLRDVLGKEREVEIQPGESVRELLSALAGAFSGLHDLMFERNGHVKPQNMVLINGRNIVFLQGLDTVLEAGDVLDLFPAAGGG